MIETFRTSPDRAILDPDHSWFRPAGAAFEVSWPLRDSSSLDGWLFASLMQTDARSWAVLHGCSLPTRDQVLAIKADPRVVVIEPHPLPDAAMILRDGLSTEALRQRARVERMRSRAWNEIHTAACLARVPTDAAYVLGLGKHWLKPDGALMGWWSSHDAAIYGGAHGPGWVQPGTGRPHPGGHHWDYATTTIVVRPWRADRDTDPGPDPGVMSMLADPFVSAGRRAAELLRDVFAADLFEGGGDLPPPDGPPPHGWHLAVWEIVASARAAGTFVDVALEPDFEPEPGDLLILGRADGDPRKLGQEGHVARIELVTPAAFVSIDGNHANQVARVTRRRRDPEIVGYVRCRNGWGARALARAQTQVGVREATGKNDGPQIAVYFAGATRDGRRTGFVPGWNWCSAFAGWSLLG